MPQFRFKCDECGRESMELLLVRQEIRADCECGQPMRRLWDAPAKHRLDFIPGYDLGLDQTFSMQSERDEYLVKNSEDVRRIK